MSDRGILLLFSLGVILAALGVAVWLISTGQVAYIDGLFLLVSSLVLALVFSLYVRYLIRSVNTAPKKITATAQEKPGTPVRATTLQSAEEPGKTSKGIAVAVQAALKGPEPGRNVKPS